eukprot:531186_1
MLQFMSLCFILLYIFLIFNLYHKYSVITFTAYCNTFDIIFHQSLHYIIHCNSRSKAYMLCYCLSSHVTVFCYHSLLLMLIFIITFSCFFYHFIVVIGAAVLLLHSMLILLYYYINLLRIQFILLQYNPVLLNLSCLCARFPYWCCSCLCSAIFGVVILLLVLFWLIIVFLQVLLLLYLCCLFLNLFFKLHYYFKLYIIFNRYRNLLLAAGFNSFYFCLINLFQLLQNYVCIDVYYWLLFLLLLLIFYSLFTTSIVSDTYYIAAIYFNDSFIFNQ